MAEKELFSDLPKKEKTPVTVAAYSHRSPRDRSFKAPTDRRIFILLRYKTFITYSPSHNIAFDKMRSLWKAPVYIPIPLLL